MTYIITKERAKFIEDNLVDGFNYIDEQAPSRELFETMTDSWEIHYFVSRFQWDNDLLVLSWIADSQLCDKATALMIFWRLNPSYYTQYATQAEADAQYNGLAYTIVRDIIAHWESNFYVRHSIAYSPTEDNKSEVEGQHPKEKWPIPDSMRASLMGEDIVVE